MSSALRQITLVALTLSTADTLATVCCESFRAPPKDAGNRPTQGDALVSPDPPLPEDGTRSTEYCDIARSKDETTIWFVGNRMTPILGSLAPTSAMPRCSSSMQTGDRADDTGTSNTSQSAANGATDRLSSRSPQPQNFMKIGPTLILFISAIWLYRSEYYEPHRSMPDASVCLVACHRNVVESTG